MLTAAPGQGESIFIFRKKHSLLASSILKLELLLEVCFSTRLPSQLIAKIKLGEHSRNLTCKSTEPRRILGSSYDS